MKYYRLEFNEKQQAFHCNTDKENKPMPEGWIAIEDLPEDLIEAFTEWVYQCMSEISSFGEKLSESEVIYMLDGFQKGMEFVKTKKRKSKLEIIRDNVAKEYDIELPPPNGNVKMVKLDTEYEGAKELASFLKNRMLKSIRNCDPNYWLSRYN